jgi:hypothetical protein
MEIFEHDKNRKAYYVFPSDTRIKDAAAEVAKDKHINPEKLAFKVGYVVDDELFWEKKKGGKRVLTVYKVTKIGG